MKKQYIILLATFISDLEKKVNAKILEGYLPHGGIFRFQDFLCQAMILNKENFSTDVGVDIDFVGDDEIK